MKTTSQILLVVATTAIIVVSCNKTKKQIEPSSQTENTTQITSYLSKEKDPKDKPNGTYITSGTWAGWCSPKAATNCKMLRMITVSARIILDGLDGVSGDAVTSAIDRIELIPLTRQLPEDYLDKLKSGNYYIHKNMENEQDVNYIIGTEYPVTMDNMEFSIQINKAY